MVDVRRLVVVSFLVGGCGLADFDVSQPLVEQRVQGSGIPGPLAALFPLPLDLDLSAKIKQQDSGPIGTVTMSSLQLTITPTARPSGDTDDWSFVDEIHVSVRSSQQGSTLPKVEIASVASPGAVTTMHFVVKDVDVKPYVDEGSIVESTGKGTVPADDVTYDGEAVFTVHPL
jgi:hypothetical protein